ncbi:MAG: hypothetical protein ABI072_08625 [Edaphobacter sp.]
MTKAIVLMTASLLLLVTDVGHTKGQSRQPCVVPPAVIVQMRGPLEQTNAEETVRLRQAPHGAKRLGKRQLQVRWSGGMRIFKDKPPYDEPLDGIWWRYCGYSAVAKVHLVCEQDSGLFTGKLLSDETGALLPGGQRVLFSPNQRYYLAYEQPDGQDGETITLYDRNGTTLWRGYNGILSSDGTTVVADFLNEHWDCQNRLVAEVHRSGKVAVTVTLTKVDDLKWEWLPNILDLR